MENKKNNNEMLRFNKLFGYAKKNRIPISCTVEITQNCNFRCPHCFIQEFKNEYLDKELFKNFIDEIKREGCIYLCITGGEALLHPNFWEMYEYAVKKGLAVTLFTNGSLLNNQAIRKLTQIPPRKIEITLYGASTETYFNITGNGNNFNIVMEAIRNLIENNIKVILKTTIFKSNYKDFKEIKNIATQLGVPFKYDFKIMPKRDFNNENTKYQVSPKDIIKLEINDSNKKIGEWTKALNKKSIDLTSEYLFECGAARYSCFLSSNYKLRICATAIFSEIDLKLCNFREAWNKFESYTLMKKENKTKCTSCDMRKICDICPIWGYLQSGNVNDLNKQVKLHCELAEERKKVVYEGININDER